MKTRIFFLEGNLDTSFLNFLIFFTIEFSPFWKSYDSLLTRLGDFLKFEILDSVGTNSKLDAVIARSIIIGFKFWDRFSFPLNFSLMLLE